MLFKKQGFPEDGELVLCTVTSVQFHSVFVDIDDYARGGMIHISEVSPGRIRNIRDFVKEGKKVVCKVLRINEEKGYIDLSLRRVNETEKRRKIEQVKREQNAEKIVEMTAEKLGLKTQELYSKIHEKMAENYSSLYALFEEASKDDSVLKKLKLEDKYTEPLLSAIKLRIKPSEVEIKGSMKITTYAQNGVELIKSSLKKANELGKGQLSINYLGSGTYRFLVKAKDYKDAEKVMEVSTESVIGFISKNLGVAEFKRESEK